MLLLLFLEIRAMKPSHGNEKQTLGGWNWDHSTLYSVIEYIFFHVYSRKVQATF
jgi:hypothetical protein